MDAATNPKDINTGFAKLKETIERRARWRRKRNACLVLLGVVAVIIALSLFHS